MRCHRSMVIWVSEKGIPAIAGALEFASHCGSYFWADVSVDHRLYLNNSMCHGFGVVCVEPPPDTASFQATSLHMHSLLLWEGSREERLALKEI